MYEQMTFFIHLPVFRGRYIIQYNYPQYVLIYSHRPKSNEFMSDIKNTYFFVFYVG